MEKLLRGPEPSGGSDVCGFAGRQRPDPRLSTKFTPATPPPGRVPAAAKLPFAAHCLFFTDRMR